MQILTAIRTTIRQKLFLEKAPEPGEITLHQRRVFTLPSKAGLLFILLLVVLYLMATNYSLNLVFGLCYLLIGLMLVNVLQTFRNLAYLKLSASHSAPVFAGETAQFHIHIANHSRIDRYALELSCINIPGSAQMIDLSAKNHRTTLVGVVAEQRGHLALPRLQLQTYFPLGLLRAWSTWLPDCQTLVFPAPEANPPELPFAPGGQGNGLPMPGNDDFAGVRSYQAGDPQRHLSWKHIARVDTAAGGALVTKQFTGASSPNLAFDFDALPSHFDIELRLSRLCSWILEAEKRGMQYSLHIAGLSIAADRGDVHQIKCLSALALYPNVHDIAS